MVWLIGCNGMLGKEISKQLAENNIPWIGTDTDVDITDAESLDNFAQSHDSATNRTGNAVANGKIQGKISWIINCAAYTAVDKAEEDAEKAKKLNEQGPRNIARTARHVGAKLIHFSTDYVFDGSGSEPYTEDMEKKPLGVYGETKSLGEDAVQKEMTQYYILRTAWLYGFEGKNFVYTMTKLMNSKSELSVVNDQKGTPTNAFDLANVVIKIIQTSDNAHHLFGKNSAIPYGIYQYTNLGEITWFDFAKKIFEFGKKYGRIEANCQILPCSTEDYPTPAKRPAYSVLSKEKIQKALKVKIPNWDDSLEKFIKSNRFSIK